MNDELAARHRAITLRLAGRPVKAICAAVGRSEVWFHKWWGRYLQAGPEGLYDLTRANHHVTRRIPPELERAILSVRGGARDLHPAGESGRDGLGPEPIVPCGEEASRSVPAPGGGNWAQVADSLPEWASAEALALQAPERLTDI